MSYDVMNSCFFKSFLELKAVLALMELKLNSPEMIYGEISMVGILDMYHPNWKGLGPLRTWQGQRQLRRIYVSFLRKMLEALI